MTLADQAAIPVHDGQVTSGKPGKPKRRTFTAAYKAKILAEFDALPENSTERGALLRKSEKKPEDADSAELARLRAENRKLQAQNDRLSRDRGGRPARRAQVDAGLVAAAAAERIPGAGERHGDARLDHGLAHEPGLYGCPNQRRTSRCA